MARSGFARLASFKFACAVFGLVALGSPAARAQSTPTTQEAIDRAYWDRQQQEMEAERNKTIHVGKYDLTRADREAFAAQVSELLAVRNDDMKITDAKAVNRQRQYAIEDINARRKYFSDTAWIEYQEYLSQQRALLKLFRGSHMMAGGNIANNIQYKPADGNKISFVADGRLFYRSQESWCDTGLPEVFTYLDINFMPAHSDAAAHFMISKWQIKSCGRMDLSCLYKNAVKYTYADIKNSAPKPARAASENLQLEKDRSDALTGTLQGLLHFTKTYGVLPVKGGMLVNGDVDLRKKYFSQTAWKQYLNFAYNTSLHTPCYPFESRRIDADLRKIEGNQFQFWGQTKYGNEAVSCGQIVFKFQNSIEYKGASYSDFIFTSWQASVCDKEGNNCVDYNDIPAGLSEREREQSTQYYLVKSLLEWGKRKSLEGPIDDNGIMDLLEDRRKFFSDAAWDTYKKYIESVNEQTEGRSLYFTLPPATSSFEYADSGDVIFSTHGSFDDRGPPLGDHENKGGAFDAKVAFHKTGDTASDVIFTDWSVTMPDGAAGEKEPPKNKNAP